MKLQRIFFLYNLLCLISSPLNGISLNPFRHFSISQDTTPIGIIPIDGEIDKETAVEVMKYIEFYAHNKKNVKGIIVVIDSNGGSPGYASLLFLELQELKQYLPVVVFIPASCYSAGYLIACAADKIVAIPTSGIGSIGVIQHIYQFTDKITATFGPFKGEIEEIVIGNREKNVGSPLQPLTDENKEKLSTTAFKLEDMFYNLVAKERKLSLDTVDTWGKGQTFLADEALELGLVDHIGSWSEAKQILIKLIRENDPDASEECSFFAPSQNRKSTKNKE